MTTTEDRVSSLEFRFQSLLSNDDLFRKLKERDENTDLKIQNMSNALKLDIQGTMQSLNAALEDKIESKIETEIKKLITNQKDKVSWGMELLRLAGVAVMFFLSVKVVTL
tara:strand:+ start:13355 stop:13684 length:330 start_codon:yes stop_codon:yes gene_type:complete